MRFRCHIRLRNPRRKSPEPYEQWAEVEVEAGSGVLAAEAAKRQMREKHMGWLVTCHGIEMLPAKGIADYNQGIDPDRLADTADAINVIVDASASPPKRGPGRPRKAA